MSLKLSLKLWDTLKEKNPMTSLCNVWQLWTQHFSWDLSLKEKNRTETICILRDLAAPRKHFTFICNSSVLYIPTTSKLGGWSSMQPPSARPSLLLVSPWNLQSLWIWSQFLQLSGFCAMYVCHRRV